MSTAKNTFWPETAESGEWRLYGELHGKDQTVGQAPEHRARGMCFDFEADDWYFYEHAPGKEKHVRQVHIHFCESQGQQVKVLLKQYAAWRLGRVRPVTVRLELSAYLKPWVRYLHVRQIQDPAGFGGFELERFGRWLRMQGIKEEMTERIFYTVFRLLVTGQRLGWKVTTDDLPRNPAYRGMIAGQRCTVSESLVIEQDQSLQEITERVQVCMAAEGQTKQESEMSHVGATQPIPEDVYEQILLHAMQDETDEITRSGILIQSQTGLRISEVLSLRKNCLKRDGNGRYWLVYRLKKTTRSEPQQRLTPANELVVATVRRLESVTETLRKESGREELFLVRNHGIHPVSQTNWNKGRLKNFMHRWDITDENGRVYELHSHQFRATYVRCQLLNGGRIEELQRRFGHVSSEMTARYVHLSQEALQTMLAPVIGEAGR